MRRIFITGGTGFIGRAIVRKLVTRPDVERIVCLTRGHRTTLLAHEKIAYWLGDVTQCQFPDDEFTDLIHGANDANDLLQPDQHHYYYSMVEGTARVFKWSLGKKMRRLLLSSGAVARDTIYGRAKRQCERIVNDSGAWTQIARIFSVVGDEMPLNGQFAVGRFVHQALNDGIVKVYGGTSVRSYLHVDDCADWLSAIMDSGTTIPVDVAGDPPYSILTVAQMVADTFGVPCERTNGPDRDDFYLPDLRKAESLGLRVTIPFDEALRRIRAHFLIANSQQAGRTGASSPLYCGTGQGA